MGGGGGGGGGGGVTGGMKRHVGVCVQFAQFAFVCFWYFLYFKCHKSVQGPFRPTHRFFNLSTAITGTKCYKQIRHLVSHRGPWRDRLNLLFTVQS